MANLFEFLAGKDAPIDRERRRLENDAMRRQLTAQKQLPGLIRRMNAPDVPTDRLFDVGGGPSTPLTDIAPSAAPGVREGVEGVTPGGLLPAIDPREADARMIGLLGDLNPAALGNAMAGQMFPTPVNPTGLEREVDFLKRMGIQPTEEHVLFMAGALPSSLITTPSSFDEPITVTDLTKLRLPDGTNPPFGTTPRQAMEMGARVFTQTDADTNRQSENALQVLSQLEALAIGPDGIFTEVEPGLLNRMSSALDFALSLAEQKDPRVSQYRSLSQGTVAPLIRAMGEKGSLSTGDVDRAIALLAQIFPLPDTLEVAKAKFAELRKILNKGMINESNGTPATDSPVDFSSSSSVDLASTVFGGT